MDFAALYRELDAQIAESSRVTRQACPPGCGACCRRPSREIEASPQELAALAQHLWESGRAPEVLASARRAGASGWCALYLPGPDQAGYPTGSCSAYTHRPLTCRLFGFAAFLDKAGVQRPLLSSVMKARDPGLPRRVSEAVAQGARLPVAAHWRLRMAEADPGAVSDLRPLNEALAAALEAQGLVRRLAQSETEPLAREGMDEPVADAGQP